MTASAPRRALVLANGDVGSRADLEAAWPGWAEGIELVVAADGGARHANGLGLAVDHWIGDGDSLPPAELERLRGAGIPVEVVAHDKDESDTELALGIAIAAGATDIVVLGAFGGRRLDHALANVSLLGRPALLDRRTALLDVGARVRLVRAPGRDGGPLTTSLAGRSGDLVSLLPFGADVEGVTTAGLRYPLADEPLLLGAARGLSNVRVAADASFTLRRGSLLVVETPVRLSA